MSKLRVPVGWGLIGCSGWAKETPGPALLAADDSRLTAILTRDRTGAVPAIHAMNGLHLANRLGGPWLAAKLRYGRAGRRLDALRRLGAAAGQRVRVYDDERAFLADPSIKAVWVVTPPYLHAEHAIAALESGKHVLCEKPLATTSADARAIAHAAKRSGRQLAVGYHMRQHPLHQSLRREIRAGAFGPPESVSFEASLHFRHPAPSAWHRIRAQSGGWAVCEAGTHLVDLALWLLSGDGRPVNEVKAELECTLPGFETDDRAHVAIQFASGSQAKLDINANAETPCQWFELSGPHGRVRCDETLFGHGGTAVRTMQGAPARTESVPAVDLYRLEVEQFVAGLRGSPDTVLATAEEGVANLELIELARGW